MKSPAYRFIPALIVLLALCGSSLGQVTTLQADPRSTYLRTNLDTPSDPVAISISSLGVVPGQQLRLEALGAFVRGAGFGDDGVGTLGLFSSSNISY